MNAEIDVSQVVLKTERLTLRPWKESDLEDFYEYARVDGVGQMAGWLPHKDREESRKILRMFIDEKRRLLLSMKGKSLVPWELSGTMRKSCQNFRKRRVVNWDLCFQRITGAGESCRKRSGGSSGICLMRLGWIFLPAAIMWKMNGRKGYRKNVVSAITGWSKRKPATEKKGTAGCRY